jgi:ERCC4-type nuclease
MDNDQREVVTMVLSLRVTCSEITMILIDSRVGSSELRPLFRCDTILMQLDFGDAAFTGSGPNGPLSIGIERKRVSDLLQSITTGRLSGSQIPGMREYYDVAYLIVEGVIKGDKYDDTLLISRDGGRSFKDAARGKQHWTMEAVEHYLSTLENMAGIRCRIVRDARSTVQMITYLHHWWSKPYARHSSHLTIHKGMDFRVHDEKVRVSGSIYKPSLCRRIAAELPGVGITRSLDVEKHFNRSVGAMWEAAQEDWKSIPGFGSASSRIAWEALHK